jgi:3-hydroxy-9,10-secoandrosta-1,3,5(10)-triene-9,17-dione monooxygenase reductase component
MTSLGPMTGPTSAPAVSPAAMRDVLGHFVSGVVVVTARAGRDFDDRGASLLGFTCQSFASLSLDPPLVSFAPARTSSTWPRIREVGAFCVNVLAEDHRELSAGFARSGGPSVDKFAGVDWCPAPSGAPVLEGVSAWIDCTLWAEYDGGDHTIAVGRVHDLGADPKRSPLLYYRGGYGIGRG